MFQLSVPLCPLALACALAFAPAVQAQQAAAVGKTAVQGHVQESAPPASAPAVARVRPPAAPQKVEAGGLQQLTVGDVTTLRLQGVARIAIGNGALVRATVVDDREIVLIAEQAGRTSMHVWMRNGRQLSYELQIVAQRPSKLLAELQELIKDLPGLSVRPLGDRIALEGRHQNRESADKVKRLAASFPQILDLVPAQPLDADPLQLERMVQIDLRVIEVKRRALEQLGIRWADNAAGPVIATNALVYSNTPWRPPEMSGFPAVNTANPVSTVLGMASKITSALRFLESRGDAWTLAEPRLSCRSGGEASFLAGGEIPIPVPQGNGSIGVEYKEYGVRIEFKPLADAQQNVDSALMVEVSEPDQRNSNGGFIAFTTNRTETRVAMKAGEPLVISGLLRERFEGSSDAVPGLGRLPLLGNLFKARERTSEKTELFVIATPRVIGPDTPANRADVQRAGELARQAGERVDERLNPPPLLPEGGAGGSTQDNPNHYPPESR